MQAEPTGCRSRTIGFRSRQKRSSTTPAIPTKRRSSGTSIRASTKTASRRSTSAVSFLQGACDGEIPRDRATRIEQRIGWERAAAASSIRQTMIQPRIGIVEATTSISGIGGAAPAIYWTGVRAMKINPKVIDIYHLDANDARGGDGADFAKA